MKKVVILGSTGSLGTQTLEVLKRYPDEFQVVGLSAKTSKEVLNSQVKDLQINPENIILTSVDGEEALCELAELYEADIVVNVLSGIAGIEPTKRALKAKKTVLLGNKESLIADGLNVMKLAKDNLIPLDSEHNAIFEILKNYPDKIIKNITIPCSGGPFFGRKNLENISAKEALAHPKWEMGEKISIESATLINKGLEVIEAHFLFDLPLEKIKTMIHPECVVHGLVEFEDEQIAYISAPDMKEHIENAFLRCLNKVPRREIRKIEKEEYSFYEPDNKTFPGIKIVKENFQKNPSKILEFLKKEEEVISQFLNGKIEFKQIYNHLQDDVI